MGLFIPRYPFIWLKRGVKQTKNLYEIGLSTTASFKLEAVSNDFFMAFKMDGRGRGFPSGQRYEICHSPSCHRCRMGVGSALPFSIMIIDYVDDDDDDDEDGTALYSLETRLSHLSPSIPL